MKPNKSIQIFLVILVCILTSIPKSIAIDNPTVYVDIKLDSIEFVDVNITIYNSNPHDVSLLGIEHYISSPVGFSSKTEWEPIVLKSDEYFTINEKHSFTHGDPVIKFLRKGSANIKINGLLYVKIGSEYFETPFNNSTTIYLVENENVAKQAVSPNITDIRLEVRKSTDKKGEIGEIITFTNITIFNPNSIPVYLIETHHTPYAISKEYDIMVTKKKLEDSSSFSIGHPERQIMQMDSIIYSHEWRTLDIDEIKYFVGDEPNYLRVKGSLFITPYQMGWSPTYFELTFDEVFTIINGSVINKEDNQKSAEKELSGFDAIFATIGLLAVVYLFIRRI